MTSDQIIVALREKADRLDRFFGTMSDDGKAPRVDRTLMLEAAATIERQSEWMAEIQMNAHQWMAAHDKLKAGKPYKLPKPADLPEKVRKLEDDLGRIEGFARTMFTGFLVGIEKNKSITGWSRKASDDAEKLFAAAMHDYRLSLAKEESDAG